jgi:hypothetical protein
VGGQDRAFIAGIHGVDVGSSEGVYINSSGQLGSGPVVPGANTVDASKVVAGSLTATDLTANAVGTSELGRQRGDGGEGGVQLRGQRDRGRRGEGPRVQRLRVGNGGRVRLRRTRGQCVLRGRRRSGPATSIWPHRRRPPAT